MPHKYMGNPIESLVFDLLWKTKFFYACSYYCFYYFHDYFWLFFLLFVLLFIALIFYLIFENPPKNCINMHNCTFYIYVKIKFIPTKKIILGKDFFIKTDIWLRGWFLESKKIWGSFIWRSLEPEGASFIPSLFWSNFLTNNTFIRIEKNSENSFEWNKYLEEFEKIFSNIFIITHR